MIAICASERVTPEQVAKMYMDNPHGAGIAWRDEVDGDKKGSKKNVVIYKKGLDETAVQELCAKVPIPFVVHFRVPSCGGPSPLLTHPFPVEPDVPLELEGITTGQVLFHNGHWHKYKDVILEASVRGGWKIPAGRWSDSRAMAFMAANQGIGVLEFISEKVVVFGPNHGDIELFEPNGWSKVGTGIWVSNRGWEHRQVTGFNRASSSTDKKKDEKGATADDKEGHTKAIAGTGDSTNKKPKVVAGRPFESYMAAVRLWKNEDISNNAFKRERKKYEEWCRKNHTQAIPRPPRWERGDTIH